MERVSLRMWGWLQGSWLCPAKQRSLFFIGLDPRKLHDVVVNRINRLSPPHQELIWTGYKV